MKKYISNSPTLPKTLIKGPANKKELQLTVTTSAGFVIKPLGYTPAISKEDIEEQKKGRIDKPQIFPFKDISFTTASIFLKDKKNYKEETVYLGVDHNLNEQYFYEPIEALASFCKALVADWSPETGSILVL